MFIYDGALLRPVQICDVCWLRSLGCTVVEMLTGNPLYHQFEGIAAAYKIATCEYPSYELPASASRTTADFLTRCFVVNFENRASAVELLRDPFVRHFE
jgi:mitogen-activated protein kinase kinase kinase 3